MVRKLILLLSFLFVVQFSYGKSVSMESQDSTSLDLRKGKKKKNGRYKKRKKLFKRKNDCDCPKH
jgi:hypothetical protein